MPVQVSYPGVYVEEDANLSFSVSSGATAIPLFVGNFYGLEAEFPPADCVAVSDWLAFERQFVSGARPEVTITLPSSMPPSSPRSTESQGSDGNAKAPRCTVEYQPNWAAYAVHHYFDNGGGPCYVFALNALKDYLKKVDLKKVDLKKDDLEAALKKSIQAYPDITLLCYCDWVGGTAESEKVYEAFNTLLDKPGGYFLLADSDDGKPLVGVTAAQTAVYYPALKTRYRPMVPADNQIVIKGYSDEKVKNLDGLRKLDNAKALCQSIDEELVDKIQHEKPVVLRASPAVAGLYAKTDRTRGVWKAPANVAVAGVEQLFEAKCKGTDLSTTPILISDEKQSELQKQGINALRTFQGKGTLVWGARTLAFTSKKWCYIPVRRLFNAAERDMQQAMRAVMFEPNSEPTWQKVRVALDNYLHTLWRLGALQGAKPEEAYRVQVGRGQTMTQDDIKQGKLIVQVGMAAVRPAEFIILQLMQWQGGSSTAAR
ncbi:phage tail sheath family protein [Mycetohabitans sp. B5]|uniref:Tail sheath protein C-terminal domain-containing protein n=1 Tax=Mycetohabitans endofungorum TaxID=417203 RepID=A0A2P5K739_9BURK|nr:MULTISPECIES: phage tail sheath C-terminal domain-containing protein [Mycetohabitans]MCG1055031.1 phage tail sheath family protein [Mycetohabitans sp. B5]PPB81913.1 hypothetical protein B0O95_11829 [Mycetohabitans endofungorum]